MEIDVFQVLADKPTGDPAVIARTAEELGFASYWLPEHAVIPQGSADIYPGKAADQPPPDYLFKIPDRLIGLARASAVTERIKLGTGVALVPERNPLLGAIEIASLDHYSGGRFLYGIGAGWNEAECTVMGGDSAHRWTQTKEAIDVIKALWSGEYVAHHGKYFDFGPLVCRPVPAQRPHPPILPGSIGSPSVLRRVAHWGDGWMPFTADLDEVKNGKAEIERYAREAGRDPSSLSIIVFAPHGAFRTAAEIEAARAAGANKVVVWLESTSEDELKQELRSLAAELL